MTAFAVPAQSAYIRDKDRSRTTPPAFFFLKIPPPEAPAPATSPGPVQETEMTSSPLFYLVIFACIAVAAVLLVGIGGFAKGGDFNRKYANKIMRLRIALQFLAVLLILLFVWLTGGL